MVTIVVLGTFFYSLFAWTASRLFNRFDPSSAYSDKLSAKVKRPDGTLYQAQSDKDDHDVYIFFGSFFWPVSLTFWLLFYLPYRIVLRIERRIDQPKKTPTSDTVYRG